MDFKFRVGKMSLSIRNKMSTDKTYTTETFKKNINTALEVIEQNIAMLDASSMSAVSERLENGDIKFTLTVEAMRLIPTGQDKDEDYEE